MRAKLAALIAGLSQSRFRRNTIVQVRADLVTQALLFLATPVLTRLFTPDDFGVAGLFSIAAAFTAALATFRFDWSIPSAETDHDANVLLGICVLITVAFTVILLGLFTLPDQVALFGLFGLEPIPFTPLVPILALASGMFAILSSAFVRSGTLQNVSQSKYVQSGTQLVSSLGTGLAGMGAVGLVMSYTVAGLAGVLNLARNLPREMWAGALMFGDYVRVLKKYARQASLSTSVNLANFAFNNSLPLLLLIGYSTYEVGIYLVVMRLANTPALLISGGISNSFWSEAAKLAKTDLVGLRRFYLKVLGRLALFAAPLSLICLIGSFYLPHVLGYEQWHQTGTILAACLPQIVGAFIFSSTNHLIVYDRQGYQLFSDLVSIGGSVAILSIAVSLALPFWGVVLLISSTMFASYVLRFALHLKANAEALRDRAL